MIVCFSGVLWVSGARGMHDVDSAPNFFFSRKFPKWKGPHLIFILKKQVYTGFTQPYELLYLHYLLTFCVNRHAHSCTILHTNINFSLVKMCQLVGPISLIPSQFQRRPPKVAPGARPPLALP